MENWKTDVDGRHECMFLEKCFLVLLTFIETDQPEFSPRLQGNPTYYFACKGGLSLTLLGGSLLSGP